MTDKSYSVKEFAVLAGVTPQAVYKHINNPSSPIQPFISKQDGRTVISEPALQAVFGLSTEVYQEVVSVVPPEENRSESHTEALIASYKEQIDSLKEEMSFLKGQIQKKDEQIAELLTLSSRALNTTNNQQYLTAVATGSKPDEQRFDQLDNLVEQPEQPIDEPENMQEPAPESKPTPAPVVHPAKSEKKRNWLSRFLKDF